MISAERWGQAVLAPAPISSASSRAAVTVDDGSPLALARRRACSSWGGVHFVGDVFKPLRLPGRRRWSISSGSPEEEADHEGRRGRGSEGAYTDAGPDHRQWRVAGPVTR